MGGRRGGKASKKRKETAKKVKASRNTQKEDNSIYNRGGGADVMPISKPVFSAPKGQNQTPGLMPTTPKISRPTNIQDFFGSEYTTPPPSPPKADTVIQPGIQNQTPGLMPGGITTVDTTTAGETDEEKRKSEEEKRIKEAEKKEKEKKDQAYQTAQDLTDWWADPKNQKGRGRYGSKKNILSGELYNTKKIVTDKIQDKLNKGFYKIVKGPNNEPLIIHASTGTPVNPYTGGIISTQTQGDQGGAYQNEMARITGIDSKNAGVFSKEYQTGNGLSVSEMKPEHALRFLMKKNKGAFEQFFNLNKDKKGFNPFSLSFISTGFGAILNTITGPEALQVGNNLERAGWGKAIKGKDGKYTIKLTKDGAKNWSDSFNFDSVDIGGKVSSGFTSPAAIAKDQNKSFLSDFLGTKKYFDPSGVASNQPVDLTNLMEQGGYLNQQATSGVSELTDKRLDMAERVGVPDAEQQKYRELTGRYGFTPNTDLRGLDSIPGTPSNYNITDEGKIQNYPTFTSEGYNIGGYNPSRDYSNQGSGGGGGGGGQDPNQDPSTTPPPGPLTFDVYGRPVTYDYSGGPEQIYLGGGYKRDGKYIGSPYGDNLENRIGGMYRPPVRRPFKDGGIANFRPYGY